MNDNLDAGNPAALQITGVQITVAAWVRIASKTAEKKIIAKWSDSAGAFSYLLSVEGAGDDKAQFAVNTGSNGVAIGSTALAIGTWHHLVGTYDGMTVRVYVDGVEDGTASLTGNISSTTAPVRIGMGSGASIEQPFDGDIGHVEIWNVALSIFEIPSLAVGISPFRIRQDNLVAYWPMNGQSPELDVVGGRNMVVTGAAVVEEPPIPNSLLAA